MGLFTVLMTKAFNLSQKQLLKINMNKQDKLRINYHQRSCGILNKSYLRQNQESPRKIITMGKNL